mmetsp:Transcript_23942/g.56555  ORF Transcript_23942/g.56555 Transcript_23942/m.56555 type:complete len:405 (+) Transcript_23942:238-1452(+)|eukprot:CAMPEP_0197181000 /NCGR_PEP_ID=MMETSP1423-20130617/5413_1 /TAXON_ID=476441 /ORGANISM="Pseudo-nitzschia heimii, Strain UNC1101" /LENGTH=404 /DNA_ID=CAMNT_0042631157 /DNA_START=180 /DNA_END=1397 /DNA_ORIENTATION=-
MIRSIVLRSKPEKQIVATSFRCSTIVKKVVQRRPFTNDSFIVEDDDDRKAFLKTISSNDEIRNSMVYCLAMSSREGSKFPPMARSLNNREREQLRISRLQRRQFRSNSPLSVAAGEKEKKQEQGSDSNAEERHLYRESLFQAIANDDHLHNSMAYSLAMAMDLDEAVTSQTNRSFNKKSDEDEHIVSGDRTRYDRMVATKQIYGEYTIEEKATSPLASDNLNLDVDDYDFEDDTLSMNSSISGFPSMTRPLNDREINQLRISKSQLVSKCTYPEQRRQKHPLPRTLQDALLPSSEAIVITENKMPFRVFNVNEAWEGLCGYSNSESKGKSLGLLLGGKETDTCAVTALIHQLFVHGEEATTVLTNYTKNGRKFRNRLSVGPLYDEETNEVSHFVGVLKEVSVAA